MKNPKPRYVTQLLALSGLVLSVACASGPLGTATNTYAENPAGTPTEFIGDRDLAAKFVLLGLKTEQREGQPKRIQFDLKNTTSADLRLEWAIEWMDHNGFQIDTQAHWRPAVVTGQGFESIQAVAPTPDAETFKLHLRKPTAIR